MLATKYCRKLTPKCSRSCYKSGLFSDIQGQRLPSNYNGEVKEQSTISPASVINLASPMRRRGFNKRQLTDAVSPGIAGVDYSRNPLQAAAAAVHRG